MKGTKLTQEEKSKVDELANEILKNKQGQKYDELVSRLVLFVEGVKFGLQKQNTEIPTP